MAKKNVTINDLADLMQKGFVKVEKDTDKKIDDLAVMVQKGFDGVDKKFEETHKEMRDGFKAVDIGPATVKLFSEAVEISNTIIWNGPMGIYEQDKFSKGTFKLATAIADCYAYTIVGGGDTADAVERCGEASNFSIISTGGGASLELLEGKILPGFKNLDRREESI